MQIQFSQSKNSLKP